MARRGLLPLHRGGARRGRLLLAHKPLAFLRHGAGRSCSRSPAAAPSTGRLRLLQVNDMCDTSGLSDLI